MDSDFMNIGDIFGDYVIEDDAKAEVIEHYHAYTCLRIKYSQEMKRVMFSYVWLNNDKKGINKSTLTIA